jgi:hypothetical protein
VRLHRIDCERLRMGCGHAGRQRSELPYAANASELRVAVPAVPPCK